MLIGIVVCGGESTRMGSDKSLINYYGKPQRYFLYELLKQFCNDVYISCNKNQFGDMEKGYEYIVDDNEYAGHGPISGLLSVFKIHPSKAVLFIGCDYPFINGGDIQNLIESRKAEHTAAAYYDEQHKIFEPLLAIYEALSCNDLKKQFSENKYSLSRYLENSNAMKITADNPLLLKNINTLEEYYSYKIKINKN